MLRTIVFYALFFLPVLSYSQYKFNLHDTLTTGLAKLSDLGEKIIQDNAGNYIIAGTGTNNNNSYVVGYMLKLAPDGDTIWRKIYDLNTEGTRFIDLKILPNNNYIVLGNSFTSTNDDVFLTEIDPNGNSVWFQRYFFPDDDNARAIEIIAQQHVIILSSTYYSSSGYRDLVLLKTHLNGNLIWRKTVNTANYNKNYFSMEPIKNNTQFLLGGSENLYSGISDYAISTVDTAGNLIWRYLYGTSPVLEVGNYAIRTMDGGYIMSGRQGNLGTAIKIDSTGQYKWSTNFGLINGSIITNAIENPDSTLTFIAGDKENHNTSGFLAGYLIKADKNGNKLWEKYYPFQLPISSTAFYDIIPTNDKGYAITGHVTDLGFRNTWVLKVDSMGCDSVSCYSVIGIKEHQTNKHLSIYPNPANGDVFITIEQPEIKNDVIEIEITDMFGKTIQKKTINSQSENPYKIKTNELQTGIYILKAMQNNLMLHSEKLIIY